MREKTSPLSCLLFRLLSALLLAGSLLPAPARAAALPDLALTRLAPSLAAQEPGGRLLLDFSLENTGTAPAENFYVRFYFTTGNLPGPGDAPLTDKLVLRLAPGERLDGRVAVRLPQGLPAGPGQFVAVADDADAVRELNETNNALGAAFSVGRQAATGLAVQPQAPAALSAQATAAAPSAPASPKERYYGTPGQTASGQEPAAAGHPGGVDLVLTSAVIPPEQYLPGQTVLVDFEIKNQGGEPAGRFFMAFCLLDGTNTARPETCPDRQMIQGLAPGTAKGDRGSVLLPMHLPAGRHTLAVIADFDDQISESDETNNALSATFTSLPPAKTEDF
ncbi:CARDB domain-containing protein [Paucidesulfovibrio longus]|uniref:CARDB domain-containing protein n=1 Tax=Paucidesulfovibrio longus TaxID=889 RepID=UPI0003B66E54|nr:CARDB domain-containing protein [Paucidesulfovibrio longus]